MRSAPPDQRRRLFEGRPGVLAAIAVGGALGTAARYGLTEVFEVRPGELPVLTLVINLSGSLVLGFLLVLLVERFPPSRFARPFLVIGFLGAYTTYSTFAVETVLLVDDDRAARAVAYVLATFVGGFLAVWVGGVLGRLVPFRGERRRTVRGAGR